MNLIKNFLVAVLLISSTSILAKGGDDAGNGGFAYKQSIKILQMAADALEKKIYYSDLRDLTDYPERRDILQRALKYDNLRKLYLWNQYRDGKKLAMNYDVKSQRVTILKPYYVAFSGKTDTELEDASLEVQKRLLHEASHLWGYKEEAAERFSIVFLAAADGGSKRPTNAIDIKSDFCSCLNGKSDIINDCASFCATKPISDQPILYVNTLLGAEVSMHPRLGNLYNWCSVQLSNDETKPQCVLNAYDGNSEINIPVNVKAGSNSFSANIISLTKNRTWILKLVETKTGSNAQTKEFQVRRKTQTSPDDLPMGALKIAPINQYSCMVYGGKVDSHGNVIRTSYARLFYYFPSFETPAPLPSQGGDNQSQVVCHDEQRYPGADSAQYERLELVPGLFNMWDKTDPRFVSRSEHAGKLLMNKVLEDRLADEYGINATLNLFYSISYPNRPSTSTSGSHIAQGFSMVPFINNTTGRSFCPTSSDYSGPQPLLSLLGEYMDDTEALYIAEKEPEILTDGTSYKTIYGTMFITESQIDGQAFYIENGVKVLADKNSFHSRAIYYYWPVVSTMDPLIQGNRKLFTVRTPDTLNGTSPIGHSTIERTSDKRIACVPSARK